jgi:ABC-type oligopeptide transport system substrate-binding subunit
MSEKNYDTSPFTWYVKGTQYLAINEKRKGKRHLAFYDIPTRKAAEGSIL